MRIRNLQSQIGASIPSQPLWTDVKGESHILLLASMTNFATLVNRLFFEEP